jgi:hypothetical protein
MKTTIIFLGLAALSFTNTIVAKESKQQNFNLQQVTTSVIFQNSLQEGIVISSNEENLINNGVAVSDIPFFDPCSVVKSSNLKTVEEIISENNLVIEATEEVYQPISLERIIEDSIAENNEIIESTISNEVYPLDFEKINQTTNGSQINNNAIKTTDIKL